MVVFVLSFFIFSFFCSVFKGKFSDLIGQKEMEIIGRIFPLDDFQTNSFYDKF
jgi:small neutral amino acid transporter SnatA (MarC family)